MIKVIFCIGLFLFAGLLNQKAIGQHKSSAARDQVFELKSGDRVVFLGNSLFENDLQFGYLELSLTTRWPDREVKFRNLGWTGDMVSGQARSQFTNPPDAYHLLLEQLTKTQPTIVFIAYGGNEAFEGEAGLTGFEEGLNKLLDTIDNLGANAVLLSPITALSADFSKDFTKRNLMLERYAGIIDKLASARSKRFIDVLNPLRELNKKVVLSDNGIHLNEKGYYYLASIIEKGLGLAPRNAAVNIRLSKKNIEAAMPAKILDPGKNTGEFKFTIDEDYLPLPLPEGDDVTEGNVKVLRIAGLKKGFYALTNDQLHVITASAKQWEEGVKLQQGASFNQARQLRTMILKKNDLFFHQYRPLNRTYIIGFRSYEQGRHVQGLEDLGLIIKWLEGQIALTRTPKPNAYQLTKLK